MASGNVVLQWLASDGVGSAAVNVFVQSSAVILAGLFAAAVLGRRRGAAVRSAVLRATLAAVALCPLASLAAGRVGVHALRVVVAAPAPAAVAPPVSSTPADANLPGAAATRVEQSPRSS